MNALTYRANYRETSRLRRIIKALRNNCGAIVCLTAMVALLGIIGWIEGGGV